MTVCGIAVAAVPVRGGSRPAGTGPYREHYFDFNVRHFHEKLREQRGLALSYTWVKLALQGAVRKRTDGVCIGDVVHAVRFPECCCI